MAEQHGTHPRARALLENLELFRAVILTVTRVRSVHPHVPTEIYAFESENDYRPFQPFASASGFFRPTLRINFVALSAGLDAEAARAILYHEYTHFVIQNEGAKHFPLSHLMGLGLLTLSRPVVTLTH